MIVRGAVAPLAALVIGCRAAPGPADCAGDLGGVWHGPAGRWQAIDGGGHIELYPIDRELPIMPAGVVAAPAVIDLVRARGATTLTGTLTRRYERGAQFCRVQTPAEITACGGGRLRIALSPPAVPTDWERCAAPTAAPTVTTFTR